MSTMSYNARMELSHGLRYLAQKIEYDRLCEIVDEEGYPIETDPIQIGRNVIQLLSEHIGVREVEAAYRWAANPDDEPAYTRELGYVS